MTEPELPADLAEKITDVQRARFRKDDRLMVRISGHLEPDQARRMADAVAHWAGVPKKHVLMTGDNAELFVAEVDGTERRMWRQTDGGAEQSR